MNTILDVQHLSKEYVAADAYVYSTLRDTLTDAIHHPLSVFKKKKSEKFWALQDVHFSVQAGEIIGILGNNGAGKSTLLKILSRITPPTQGEVHLNGRLGSLLEVGTGFHPELTGRENIFLAGAILGMTRREVQDQFKTIVAFAEVEKFLDTPMKHYSTGMYMRLAFAVAAHLQSEIILIDEVLAVGDVEFQKKCLGKMGDIAQQGRTILFVSHNMGAVQNLCTRCVVLEKGKSVFIGKTDKAIAEYLKRSHQHSSLGNIKNNARGKNVTLLARLEKIKMITEKKEGTTLDSSKEITIELQLSVTEECKTGFYISIKDESRRPVLLFSSGHLQGKEYLLKKGKQTLSCTLQPTHLTSGRYSIDCGLLYPNRDTIDFVEDALFFNVTHSDPYKKGFDYSQHFGSFFVPHVWKVM